jgi:hypothetical protein
MLIVLAMDGGAELPYMHCVHKASGWCHVTTSRDTMQLAFQHPLQMRYLWCCLNILFPYIVVSLLMRFIYFPQVFCECRAGDLHCIPFPKCCVLCANIIRLFPGALPAIVHPLRIRMYYVLCLNSMQVSSTAFPYVQCAPGSGFKVVSLVLVQSIGLCTTFL